MVAQTSTQTPVGTVLPADTVPLGLLVAAAILRASGRSLEAAASEACTLEILVRRGPIDEVNHDQPF